MFERLAAEGWYQTVWDSRRAIHLSPDKIHIAGNHTRRRESGDALSSNQVTYIITRQGESWGVQARFGTGRFDVGAAIAEEESSARAAVESYFEAFNTTDSSAWVNTLHFPHVRLSASELGFWATPEDFLSGTEPGRQRTWPETKLNSCELIQIGPQGANFAVSYTRLSAQGESLSTYEAIYLVTRRDGRWAVQARSSYVP